MPKKLCYAKLILNLNVITHDDFKDILLTNKEIFEQTWTREQSSSERQSGNTVIGSISESLFAESFKPLMQDETFFKVNNNKVSSYGDFIIMCLPNNLWISVKSSNARERLLASGYSNDIIGIGFFKDPKEFSDLKKEVTSPNGTTEAALNIMKKNVLCFKQN